MSVNPDGPRWAPFPVQDWSRLPDDEWTGRLPADPRVRVAARPWVVVALTLVLVAAGLVVADRAAHPGRAGGSGAAAFVPADGAVAYGTRRTQDRQSDRSVTVVTEAAVYEGRQLALAVEVGLADDLIGALQGDLARGRYLRTTTATVGDQGAERTAVYRTDGPLVLLARSDPGGSEVFRPGLTVLPADPAPGQSWTEEGVVGTGRYRAERRVEDAPGDCLRVIGTLTLTGSGGVVQAQESAQTWCPGRGVSAEVGSVTSERAPTRVTETVQPVTRLTDLVPAVRPRTTDAPEVWRPDRWTARSYGVASVDARLNGRPLTEAPGRATPAVTASGLLHRVGSGSRDVYALTPQTPTQWRTLWRLHPGGTVLAVRSFGDVLVLTTSRREVVGYDDAGVRLWTHSAGELVTTLPTRVDEDAVAVVSADGQVTVLELRTGRPRWTAETGADVGADPTAVGAAGAGVVVVAGRDGSVHGLAAADGSQRWSLDAVAPERLAALGPDRLLLLDGADLDGVDAATGRRLWRRPVPDAVRAVAPVTDGAVVATAGTSLVIDRDGGVRARLPAYRRLDPDGGGHRVVAWGEDALQVLTATGAVVTRIPVPATGLVGSWITLPHRTGVWRFSTGWDFTSFSDEP